MSIERLRNNYADVKPLAERLKVALLHEIGELLAGKEISLAVPLEARVKSWVSLEEKLERKALSLASVETLDDLVGIRSILLFRSDLSRTLSALSATFRVISLEDTGARLEESQFGYQSQHMIVQLPEEWSRIPSFRGLTDLRAEVQIRTVAQHIWAAASHKLQYKQEQNVPPPLRRTIHRISALLETVDLELDRVLEERSSYAQAAPAADTMQPLNVDLLSALLSEIFTDKNKAPEEDYSDLLSDLIALKVVTAEQLKAILGRHIDAVRNEEARRLMEERASYDAGEPLLATTKDRIDKGVFFTHTGLTRSALRFEFGDWALNR
ncbi:hypothetical protein [Variovorax rhizosphaerae]|uniref:RelA/SpoT domain-containing protein n=1 Tax=Variovorax rhizosphaerae TaxID=1836200 RepID=A0ABU8WXS1_9BURK